MKLYNNGYVVAQPINYNKFTKNYNGIESFSIWPLNNFQDDESIKLSKSLYENWLSYFYNYPQTVSSKSFIEEYLTSCYQKNIKAVVLRIDTTHNFIPEIVDKLDVSEILGFDCIAGANLSYMAIDESFFKIHFNKLFAKLNNNMLFDDYTDAKQFTDEYVTLVKQGENLEWISDVIFPARISICNL